jgi:hypothetical protein
LPIRAGAPILPSRIRAHPSIAHLRGDMSLNVGSAE